MKRLSKDRGREGGSLGLQAFVPTGTLAMSPDRRHRGSHPFNGGILSGGLVQKGLPRVTFRATVMNSQLQSNTEKPVERVWFYTRRKPQAAQ